MLTYAMTAIRSYGWVLRVDARLVSRALFQWVARRFPTFVRFAVWSAVAVTLGMIVGLAAIVLQCIEYIKQPFGPTNGAFASVFVAWTGFYLIAVLATMYWLETQVATEIVERRRQETHHIDPATGYENPDELLPRGLDAVVFYWAYLAGLGVLMYVILYLL